ncbi:antitoxin MazE family protein [Paenalcaligenes faecalis]|uniref:antitoxin MazE family protein n=1 Tax=Paenalcaligenes faecalis TaxID=2980099 RepID=UPI0022B9AFD1|nr:antitoxin MazE family protein [Paenalcaligenes faecalis]
MRPDTPNSTSRVQKHRAKLRKAGMKPVQIWVPDTTSKAFIAECERQSRLIAQSDDVMTHGLLDEALIEVDGWE